MEQAQRAEPAMQEEPKDRVWPESAEIAHGRDYKKRPKKKTYRAEPVGSAPKEYRSYGEKLKDPRWQRKRLEAMDKARFTCQMCGETEATLNVHHVNYTKGKEPWDYENSNFRCYCEPCHSDIEANIKKFREFCCGCLSPQTIQTLIVYLSAGADRILEDQNHPYPGKILRYALNDMTASSAASEVESMLAAIGLNPRVGLEKTIGEIILNHL